MSLMTALPDRQRPLMFPPHCVRCQTPIDVFAQWVCDECRELVYWEFFGLAVGPGRYSSKVQPH